MENINVDYRDLLYLEYIPHDMQWRINCISICSLSTCFSCLLIKIIVIRAVTYLYLWTNKLHSVSLIILIQIVQRNLSILPKVFEKDRDGNRKLVN